MSQATITETIVAVFSDYATAERAAQDLFDNDFARSEVKVTSNESLSSDAALGNIGLSGEAPRGESAGGGIAGFFRKLFGADVDDDESTTYADAMRRGNAVVIVRADENRVEAAQDILERYSPLDIGRRKSSQQGAYGSSEGERTIPVVEEELQVGKRAVERGGLRVYSRTVEQPVEEEVTLREEHVHVERRPVNREATQADIGRADAVIEMTETVEEPVVSKKARVREEVVISKDATSRKETIRDTVRQTDVTVQQKEGAVSDDYTVDFERDFKTRYASETGATYKTYAPAYEYGYRMAGDQRYRGKSWDDVEDTLKTDYLRNNPTSKWDQVKGAVRYGWEKMTGKR